MISKLAGLLLGITGFGLALAVQDSEPAGVSDGAPRTARMVRPDHRSSAYLPEEESPSTNVATVASSPAAGPSETDELRRENRQLSAKIEQLETRVNELLSALQPAARAAAATTPPIPNEDSARRATRTRRADQAPTRRDSSEAEVRRIRQEASEATAAMERELADVQKQLEQVQRDAKKSADEVKRAGDERAEAVARAAEAEKQRDKLTQSLQSARQERDVAKADAEAAARSRDEALRTVEYAKKDRDEAVQGADEAIKQAKEANQQRESAVNGAKVAQADRDQARAQAVAAQQARDTARRVSQELQRQRLAAYEESRVARLEVAETRQALAAAERTAEERRRSLELFRSAEHQWSQFAVQLASAVGIKDALPPQDERWSARESATQAWLDKVRVRYAQVLVPVARPSDADRTGANFSYVEGLRHLRQQDYRAAVQRFSEAIDRYPQDARYFYLRGMSRHLAANGADLSEAERDVRRGAELEKQNSPGSRAVDQALERFQGASRLWAEKFRR